MEIKIFYRLVHSQEVKELVLSPEEYFDLPMEEENGYSIDSTAKFIFPYEYLNYELKDIIFIDLSIKDQKSHSKREMFFWNEGKNSTDYIFDYNSKNSSYFEWLITTTVVTNSEGYDIEETLRLYKNEDNRWIVTDHSYRTLMPPNIEDILVRMDVHKSIVGHISGFRSSERFIL